MGGPAACSGSPEAKSRKSEGVGLACDEVYNLSCAAAHPLKPGASEAFAIELHVPESSPVGPNGLFWQLDPWGTQMPQLHAGVAIRR